MHLPDSSIGFGGVMIAGGGGAGGAASESRKL